MVGTACAVYVINMLYYKVENLAKVLVSRLKFVKGEAPSPAYKYYTTIDNDKHSSLLQLEMNYR